MGQPAALAEFEDFDMAFASKPLAVAAFLALLPLGACASEGVAGGYGGPVHVSPGHGDAYGAANITPLTPMDEARDGLLSSPPNNARPGECYAKVVVPGQRIGPPPAQPRAVWVQTPPGPGQVIPTWCIYYLPGAPTGPVTMTPERYGWIRVICDKDATEEKIRHVQRRLHAWGDYDGAYDGHFDDVTAHGVVRFQEQRHIEHGGYLSIKTVDALDGAPPPELIPAFDGGHPNPNAPTIYASPVYQAQAGQQATVVQSMGSYQQAAPCGVVACPGPAPVFAPPAPPAPPQVIYAPPPPPQVVVQRVIQRVYVQQPQPVYVPQPVYAPPPVYAQAPQPCGQPACAPAPYPCGGAACGVPGGQGWGGQGQAWGGGYGQQGAPPYRALLSWPGKSTY